MERASYRDQVLLGHGSRKLLGYPFPASSPKLPLRNSDVDFSDVFGGPPRSSFAEMRSSIGETVDSLAVRRGEETPPLRNSWSNFCEKPVFGGESPNRRRQPGGDFFDDIFRIDDSLTTTPRKQDRDPLSSTPSSRALSPVRPLPPKFEQFGEGSSFPAELGLSSKLTKGTDYSTSSTPCHSPVGNKEGSLSTFAFPSSQRLVRVASEKKLGQDYSRYDSRAFYRQSRFSHEFSLSADGSSKDTESARQESGSQFSKDCSSSEVSGDNSQFHFSIYKWASKGVTLMMPLKGGKRTKSIEHGKDESIVSALPAPVLQGVNLSSLDENMSNPNKSFHFQYDIQDVSSSRDLNLLMENDIVEEPMLSTPEPKKPLHNSLSDITEEPGRNSKLHPHSSAYSSYTSLSNPADKEECQPIVNLHCPLNDSSDEPGKDMLRPDEEEIGMPINVLSAGNVDGSIKVKTQTGGKIILNHTRATGPSSQVEMLNSEDKMPENRVKGKVKEFVKMPENRVKGKVREFVKIFNQEASPKHTCNINTKGRSSRRKDLGAFKVEDSSSFSTMKAYGKETVSNEQCSKILTDAPAMADQISRQTRMAYIDVNINNQKIHDFSSENNSISRSYSETKQEEFKKTFENTQECHSEDLHLNCLVEQSPGELQKQQEIDHDQDEIQISNAKIQKWSHGKEGNIRSLLSTLHYILWPDSGWRPLPLVDIIEGTSVKRAYQKALLCLHPDKLQQKGAPTHHKYIAEKVFDILQEAWDHFNSLSAI